MAKRVKAEEKNKNTGNQELAEGDSSTSSFHKGPADSQEDPPMFLQKVRPVGVSTSGSGKHRTGRRVVTPLKGSREEKIQGPPRECGWRRTRVQQRSTPENRKSIKEKREGQRCQGDGEKRAHGHAAKEGCPRILRPQRQGATTGK